MTKRKKKEAASPLVQVRLNQWYGIDSLPIELAAECVVACAHCSDQSIATWLPISLNGRPHLGFVMARREEQSANTQFRAKSEFSRFKITRIHFDIEIGKSLPFVSMEMYRTEPEMRAYFSGDPNIVQRVIN